MGKKDKKNPKEQNNPPQNEGEQNEEIITSRKEINATLDMIIRNLEFFDSGSGGGSSGGSGSGNGGGNGGTSSSDSSDSDDDDCNVNLNLDCTAGADDKSNVNFNLDNLNLDCGSSDSGSSDTGDSTTVEKETKVKFKPIPIPPIPGPADLFLTCVDLLIFELDEDVVEKLIFCAIISMSLCKFLECFKKDIGFCSKPALKPLEPQLDAQIANVYNQFLLNIMNGVQTAKSKKDYLKTLLQTNHTYLDRGDNLADLLTLNMQNIFNTGDNKVKTEELQRQLERNVKISAINFFHRTFARKLAEFQESVNLKVLSIKEDLIFLSTEILRFTAADAGILRLGEALNIVIASRFAEDDEFKEIFDAVEELADTIEDLAEIYQDRLKVLRALLPFSFSRRIFKVFDPLVPVSDTTETDTTTIT